MVASCERPTGSETPTGLRLELQRDVGAPAIARAAVTGHCVDLALSKAACRTLVLLVSEVVSNAVLHSRAPAHAPIILTASATEQAIRITVTDVGGQGFTPEACTPRGGGGGYGLYLLDTGASQWGVEPAEGTRVWFELPRRGAAVDSRQR